jgi:hypothetical protein
MLFKTDITHVGGIIHNYCKQFMLADGKGHQKKCDGEVIQQFPARNVPGICIRIKNAVGYKSRRTMILDVVMEIFRTGIIGEVESGMVKMKFCLFSMRSCLLLFSFAK